MMEAVASAHPGPGRRLLPPGRGRCRRRVAACRRRWLPPDGGLLARRLLPGRLLLGGAGSRRWIHTSSATIATASSAMAIAPGMKPLTPHKPASASAGMIAHRLNGSIRDRE
jgi:hypothetical protein